MTTDHRGPAMTPKSDGRRRAEEISGLVIIAVTVAIGGLSLAVQDPHISRWGWAVLLVICISGILLSVFESVPLTWRRAAYAAAVLSSWAMLLTMPSEGMLVVILVVIAAVGTSVLPIRAVLVVVALNCTVTLFHFLLHGVFSAEIIIAVAFYALIHLATVLSTYSLERETAVRAELEEKNLELTTASVLLEDSAKTAERLRISRELHDLIGHQLTVLNLELEAAKHRPGQQAREHIDQAAVVAKDLLADVRSTVGELRGTGASELPRDLERIAAAVLSLQIYVEADEDLDVDEHQSAALLRAAQEIITNTIKHSQADELVLSLWAEDGQILLRGVNDGQAPKTIEFGHGLTGLRERLKPLGGDVQVTPQPEFTVQVSLPASTLPRVSPTQPSSTAESNNPAQPSTPTQLSRPADMGHR